MLSVVDYKQFEIKIRSAFTRPLPGEKAHTLMSPPNRPIIPREELKRRNVRQSAVAALFTNHHNSPHLILIKRATYKGVHSGQIGFPGGRREMDDRDFLHTALRETREEIGLNPGQIEIIGQLTDIYIPPSNFEVKVFTGVVNGPLELKPDPREVDEIILADLNDILRHNAIFSKPVKARDQMLNVPVFEIQGHTIWGATAMMISELREMLSSGLDIHQ